MPGRGQVELSIRTSSPSELADSTPKRRNYQLLEKGSFVYDALYAWCLIQTGSGTN